MTYNYYGGVQHLTKDKIKVAWAALLALASAMILSLSMFTTASAQATGNYTLLGAAQQQSDGIHLASNTNQPFSGIDFELEDGTTVSDLESLEANIKKIVGNCGGGAPRFSIETAEGNIFVYLGDAPNFNTCADGSTGNLLDDEDLRVDTTQVGGTFYDTWANAQTLVGNEEITSLSLVLDGGWAGSQEIVVSSVKVNETTYNFSPATSKEQCKNGGWKTFGNMYKNQGQCVAAAVSSESSKHNR